MTWNELIDRCELFCDAPRNLLKNLLLEAEEEMTRTCNIYEETVKMNTSDVYDNTEQESGGMGIHYPTYICQFKKSSSIYKKMILAMWKGHKLKALDDVDIFYDNDGEPYSGEPHGYCIKNNALVLDKDPGVTTGQYLQLKYYAMIKNEINISDNPKINEMYHRDLCDYAIYMATVKDNPTLSANHLQIWMARLEMINSQEGDRELTYTIREEI